MVTLFNITESDERNIKVSLTLITIDGVVYWAVYFIKPKCHCSYCAGKKKKLVFQPKPFNGWVQ